MIAGTREERRQALLYLGIALLVPAFAVGYANAVFAYNHFYETGAYMLDSGWFSHVIHRNGVTLHNPPIADGNPSYFQLHTSLLFLASSLVSYLVPVDRIDWYWIFQGIIHAPLGLAVGLLLPPSARPRQLGAIAGVALVGVLFAFDGQALACMGYPHYELLLSAGLCVMLAGLATGRTRLAWAGIAMAIGTREDGGVHALTFLGAVFAAGLFGKPFPVPRRTVVIMGIVAGATTLVMMQVQKRLFHGVSLFQHEYLGEPAFAHLSAAVLSHRLDVLVHSALYVVAPLVAVMVVAAIDRDPRWLLGWAAGLPWLALNFLAHQELKSKFDIYTGFPFVGCLFWVGAYGVVKLGARAALLRLAACSLASIAGVYLANPGFTQYQMHAFRRPADVDAPAIRRFARTLRSSPSPFGRILADPSAASLATESLPAAAIDTGGAVGRRDAASYDSYAYYRNGLLGSQVMDPVLAGPLPVCGRLPRTDLRFCTRAGRPLPDGFVPISAFVDNLSAFDGGHLLADGRLLVDAGTRPQLGAFGPYLHLAAGEHHAAITLSAEGACPAGTSAHVELYVHPLTLTLGAADVPLDGEAHDVSFVVTEAAEGTNVEGRFFRSGCAFVITSLSVSGPPAPPR